MIPVEQLITYHSKKILDELFHKIRMISNLSSCNESINRYVILLFNMPYLEISTYINRDHLKQILMCLCVKLINLLFSCWSFISNETIPETRKIIIYSIIFSDSVELKKYGLLKIHEKNFVYQLWVVNDFLKWKDF